MFSPAVQRQRDSYHGMPGSALPTERPMRFAPRFSPPPARPSTGTPAPWLSKSLRSRILLARKSTSGDDGDPFEPVLVRAFPKLLRDTERDPTKGVSGGIDRGASLAWIICADKIFVWNFLLISNSDECIALDIPAMTEMDNGMEYNLSGGWIVSIVKWGSCDKSPNKITQQCNSAGLVICNKKTEAIVFWPDIYSHSGKIPVVCMPHFGHAKKYSSFLVENVSNWQQQLQLTHACLLPEPSAISSFIASPIPGAKKECLAISCHFNGELCLFHCTHSGIHHEMLYEVLDADQNQAASDKHLLPHGYARSLLWQFNWVDASEKCSRKFFLLLDDEVQCWELQLSGDSHISKLWSQRLIGKTNDFAIKVNPDQKVFLLDMQVDDQGKELTFLLATVCKDEARGAASLQYSLLKMLYRQEMVRERMLEKRDPIQVIVSNAELQDVDFLFSMRLRVGNMPLRSVMVLSSGKSATVVHYSHESVRLYPINLPDEAGRVLDASVLLNDRSWVLLTEDAGVWALPEKMTSYAGFDASHQGLSYGRSFKKAHGNVNSPQSMTIFNSWAVVPEKNDEGGMEEAANHEMIGETVQMEELVALVNQLFHNFLLSGQIEGLHEKLKHAKLFDKCGGSNAFVLVSKSIVDALPKHWSTAKGSEVIALSVLSAKLHEKQQKHEKYLQFLALSKFHEDLCSKRKESMQVIMEHGEKLAAMIVLREIQNSQNKSQQDQLGFRHPASPEGMTDPIWCLIQVIGEKARRKNVLLMDRNNAEVFYSKASEMEEVFRCLAEDLDWLVLQDELLESQIQKIHKLSTCVTAIVRSAMNYRITHHIWYPEADGLTPWYCQHVVLSGLWAAACSFLPLSREAVKTGALSVELHSDLKELSDVLLEIYLVALISLDDDEEHKSLVEDYCEHRDTLLSCLYEQVHALVNAMDKDFPQDHVDLSEPRKTHLREHLLELLNIARRHEGYLTMWNICSDLNDTQLLHDLMEESVGPRGGFSYFVFKQLYETRNYSKVLRLGEDFPEVLAVFLKQHKELLWLHELLLNNFLSASDLLYALAHSERVPSNEHAVDGSGYDQMIEDLPIISDRKYLLSLSRIAALAGGNAFSSAKVRQIEADLRLLKLQNDIMNQLGENQGQSRLWSPVELVKICLQSRNKDLALLAFDVFAWIGKYEQAANKMLLEECWKNAIDQDNWLHLSHLYSAGLGDEETVVLLKETLLFKASKRCYGSYAQFLDGSFEDVFPLQENGITLAEGSSVVRILMQHVDFPEAGKLMQTAVMMGASGDDAESTALMLEMQNS